MGIRKTLVLVILVLGLISALPLRAQEKPFTQDQISNMVRDGFGDDSGAKLIEQRGMDFTPGQDFLQKAQGSGGKRRFSERNARVQAATGASPGKPLNEVQCWPCWQAASRLPRGNAGDNARHQLRCKDDYVQQVRQAGGDEGIISASKAPK